MRVSAALLWLLAAAVVAQAAPPVVTLPPEVTGDVAAFVVVKATVKDGKSAKFVPIDSGLSVFPAGLLADPFATVVVGQKAGRYRILCYSGNADGPSEPVMVTVVIGGAKPEPDKPDPVKPDVVKAERVAVVVIEETLSRTVKQAEQLNALRKWCESGGHTLFVLDKDDPAASKNGYLPYAKELPAVLVFDAKGKSGDKPLSVVKLDGDTANKVKEVVK